MRHFFKFFFASFLAMLAFTFFVMIVLVGWGVSTAVSNLDESSEPIPEQAVIQIKLKHGIVDSKRYYDDIDLPFFSMGQELDIHTVEEAIEAAKDDSNIKGISLELDIKGSLSLSNFNRLYDALKAFKASGKFIYAYNTNYSQKEYVLSSLSDSVFIEPTGLVDLRGIGIESLYLKDLWKKVGVDMLIFRRGKYKSAVEPHMANTMSQENKEQLSRIIEVLWDNIEHKIIQNRNISKSQLSSIVNGVKTTNLDALKKGRLVDLGAYKDEYLQFIKDRLKLTEDISFISIHDYAQRMEKEYDFDIEHEIAVLYAEGAIMNQQTANDAPSINESIIQEIKKIRQNKTVKAAVIRINSPGGDAQLSDRIWHAIQRLGDSIPVVVSMGNYAASGGYYIAMGGHYIMAEPLTLTGSIGVFASIPNFHKLAKDVGVTPQYVQTHAHSNLMSVFKNPSKEAKSIIDKGIGQVYNTFLKRVAQNRQMSTSQVDKLAQGRVWVGKDAVQNGLVDEIGGLEKAIQKSAQLAGIENYEVINFPKKKSILDLESLFGSNTMNRIKSTVVKSIVPETLLPLVEQIQVADYPSIQTRLPYVYTIHY